jgi:nucleotide-binding universal stress UspA family protein
MNLLFATDGSEAAGEAQAFLQALPLPAGTVLHVLSVVSYGIVPIGLPAALPGGSPRQMEELHAQAEAAAAQVVREAALSLRRPGLDVKVAVLDGEPAVSIIDTARESAADLVVVGSKGLTGVKGFLLGSVARHVARHAGCPVLVAHAPAHGLRQAIVAVDGSEHAWQAVECAARLPLPPEVEWVVVHVTRPVHADTLLALWDPSAAAGAEEAARRQHRLVGEKLVTDAATHLRSAGRRASAEVREGDAALEITNLAAERGADLIVAGARGVSGLRGLLTGSVADRLLESAGRSVLIVR